MIRTEKEIAEEIASAVVGIEKGLALIQKEKEKIKFKKTEIIRLNNEIRNQKIAKEVEICLAFESDLFRAFKKCLDLIVINCVLLKIKSSCLIIMNEVINITPTEPQLSTSNVGDIGTIKLNNLPPLDTNNAPKKSVNFGPGIEMLMNGKRRS